MIARTFDELGLARKAAYERSKAQARRMKEYQDERRGIEDPSQKHAFGIGDMVRMKYHEKEKFEFNWKGPYYITRLGPPGTYYLMDPRGRHLDSAVNQNHLAPWTVPLEVNQEYFYDESKRKDTEPEAMTPLATAGRQTNLPARLPTRIRTPQQDDYLYQ